MLGVLGRYRPTNEAMEDAINFFRKQIADNNKDVPYNPDSLQYYEDAKYIVDKILDDGIKAKKRTRGLPDITYINKTLEDAELPSTIALVNPSKDLRSPKYCSTKPLP